MIALLTTIHFAALLGLCLYGLHVENHLPLLRHLPPGVSA